MIWEDVERPMAIFDPISGVGFALLGLWVLTLRPRRAATTALGVFALAKGVDHAVASSIALLGILTESWTFVSAPASLVASGALVVLATRFPRALGADEKRLAFIAAAATGVVLALLLPPNVAGAETRYVLLRWVAGATHIAIVFGVLLFLALRYPRLNGADERRAAPIVSVALGIELLVRSGISPVIFLNRTAGTVPGAYYGWIPAAAVGMMLALVALWLRNTAIGAPEGRRTARNVALLFAGTAFAAAAIASTTGASRVGSSGILGAARVAGVLLLAYAILRHQLLGLDVRVRWGVSRSTVAAAFVAAFFLASEGAQLLLGAANAWVGLAAAGALVFAMAPLQRAAERLAERAVPGPAATTPEGPAAVYRRQVQHAWSDGHVDAPERLMLNDLRAHLGLSAEEAEGIEADVAGRTLAPPGVL